MANHPDHARELSRRPRLTISTRVSALTLVRTDKRWTPGEGTRYMLSRTTRWVALYGSS